MTDLTIARIEALTCSVPLAITRTVDTTPTDNPLRDQMCSASYDLAADGTVSPLGGAGLGVDVDEEFSRAHPLPGGPAWR